MAIKYRRGSEEFDGFMERLNECLGDEKLNYAGETLKGIFGWCDKNGLVTDKQETAVINIVGKERWEEDEDG